MDESWDFSEEYLETCSYRELQQTAKALKLPSNVKKTYLVKLINAKQTGTEEQVTDIVKQVRLQRMHSAQTSKKKSKCKTKKLRLQGTEVSSTNNTCYSPPISMTPKRPAILVRCTPEHRPALKQYPGNIQTGTLRTYSNTNTGSDRVLRSKMRPQRQSYSFINDSFIGVIRAEKDRAPRERQISIISHEGGYPKLNLTARCVIKKQNPTILAAASTSCVRSGNTPDMVSVSTNTTNSLVPIKRQKPLSGIYAMNSKQPMHQSLNQYISKRNFEYIQSIGYRRTDGKISKINAVVLKPQNKFRFQDLQTNSSFNNEVTIQDIINDNIDAQTFTNSNVSEYITTDSNMKNYPNMSSLTDVLPKNYPNLPSSTDVLPKNYPNMSSSTDVLAKTDQNMSSLTDILPQTNPNTSSSTDVLPKNYLNMSGSTDVLPRNYPNMSSSTDVLPRNYPNMSILTDILPKNYPNMSILTDIIPTQAVATKAIEENEEVSEQTSPKQISQIERINTMFEETDSTEESFAVYYHKKIRSEQVKRRGSTQEVPRSLGNEQLLPKISNVFSKFNDVSKTQPLYVQVSDESERLVNYASGAGADRSSMLEPFYNFRRQLLTHQPLLQVATTSNTRCVYSTSMVATANWHSSERTTGMCFYALLRKLTSFGTLHSCERDSQNYQCTNDEVSQLCEFLELPEQEITLRKYHEAMNTSTSSLETLRSQDLGGPVTLPEMMEDALEIISQDGDYMERIGIIDVRMQCILCSWAGSKIVLEHHIRKDHADQIQTRDKPEWNITYKLGSLVNQDVWLSQVVEHAATLYILSVKYEDPDCFMVALSTLSTNPETSTIGSITVYNKVTGEPYSWHGAIKQLPSNMPYENDCNCLKLELSRLNLLPNSANLKLLNRELVLKSPSKVVVGQPELNDIHIIMFVKIFYC